MSIKNESEARKVFEMVQNLKNRYGAKVPDEPDEKDEDKTAETVETIETESDLSADSPAEEIPEEIPEEAEEPLEEEKEEESEPEEALEEAAEEDAEEESETDPEELEKVVEKALLDSEFSEELPDRETQDEQTAKEPEEFADEPPLPEDLIYEAPEEETSEENVEEETDEGDLVLENQIAIDVPQTEDMVPSEEEVLEESATSELEPTQEIPAAPSPAPATQNSPSTSAEQDFMPLRSTPVQREGKPIVAEQLSLVNPPVMKADGMAKGNEEVPSIESLERSVPDLSKLSDEERRRRSGLSDEDIRMMLEFGYEDDLNRLLGYRTVRKLKYSFRKKTDVHMDLHPFAYSGKEFDGSPEGRSDILRAYRKDKIYLLLRLALTGLFAFALLICDFKTQVLPGNIFHIFDSKILGVLFLAGTAIVSHRTLIGAYKSLVFFSPTPHSIPAMLLPIALVSDLLSFLDTGESFPAVNFIIALAFLASAAGDLFRFFSEKQAFLVLSAASPKIAPELYIHRKKKLQRDQKIVCLIDDSPDDPEYRVRPVGRITGFFRRCGNLSDVTREFSFLLSLSFGLSALGALLVWGFKKNDISAVSTFINLFFFSAPISAILAFFYPSCLASRKLSRKRTAIIGEESIAELNRKKTLLFSDSRVFKAGKCTQTPLRKDSDFKEDLRLAGILFRKLGGVPAQIATPLFPEGPDPAVSILRIREDGVEALVDNRYHLLAGSREYLLRYGIRFQTQSEPEVWQSADCASLFVAIDDVLKLRYDIEYRRLEDFQSLLQELKNDQTTAGIFTYDPNLTPAFLRRLYCDEVMPTLVKPGAFDEETEVHVTDAPAVTLGKDETLAVPSEVAATVKRARRIGLRAQLIASVAGAVFSAALILGDKASALGPLTLIPFHITSLVLTWGIVTSQFNQPRSHS